MGNRSSGPVADRGIADPVFPGRLYLLTREAK